MTIFGITFIFYDVIRTVISNQMSSLCKISSTCKILECSCCYVIKFSNTSWRVIYDLMLKLNELIVNFKGAIGAGANIWESRLEAPCWNPCRGCAIAGLSFLTPKNECVPGRMCVNCQTARNCSCNSSNCFSFLVGLQYHFRRVGPVRVHADGCLSVSYSRIPTVLAPWSVRNQLPLQINWRHVGTRWSHMG